MQRRSHSPLIPILGGFAAVIIVLWAVWAIAPEDVRGLLMVAGGAVTAVAYLVLYAIQRRRHWGV